MAKGGARPNSGPPPTIDALNRNRDGKDWTRLPATGRTGAAPEWPEEVEAPEPEELLLWRRLWAMPQALVWEADHVHDLVALYCRVYIEAMGKNASAATRAHARVMGNELLLTPDSLLRGRYVIKGTPEDKALADALKRHPANGEPGARPGSARDRMGAAVVPIRPDLMDDDDFADDGSDEDEDDAPEDGRAVDPAPDHEPPPF